MARIKIFLIMFIVMTWLFSPVHVHARNKIFNIRHWAAPDHVRVVIDASDDIPYTVGKAEKKLQIDFEDTETPEDLPSEIIVTKPGIHKITVIPLPNGSVRVGLSLTENVHTKVFHIARIPEKPYRVVVDIEFPDVEKQEGQEREQVKVLRKDKIIVIDPGHGGEDPGAVGRLGTKEKKVVLEISKRLKDNLNKKKGYRAFLTRNGDYYVPFKKRMKIAREYGADLFISVHADAFRRRGARGSSVYCLSLRGASSEAAKILARNENLADMIGGSPNGESSDELDPIILNMFQTNTINSSKIFGTAVLRHLDRVNHVKFKRVQEAPFIVLKLPEIPSLLVETAYISNPNEEKKLRNSRFQTDIARALTNSISEFLPVKPVRPSTVPKVVFAKNEDKHILPDTEQHPPSKNTPHTDKSLPEEIKLHKVDKADATKSETAEYYVRKGDTMEMIASMHNTSITTLLKLNNMKLDDSLHEGRTIKVPMPQKNISGEKHDKKARASTERTDAAPSVPVSAMSDDVKKKDAEELLPPVRTESSSMKPASAVVFYKVRKGDSLDKIARKHDTTIGTLLKLNNMKMRDPLYVGRLVRVAAREKDIVEAEKSTDAKVANTGVESSSAKGIHKVALYKVKRGDSLDKIAKKHNTTIGTLLKLNNMKITEALYIGRKLKIPDTGDIKEGGKKPVVAKSTKTYIYKVRKGDTLDKIARRFKVSAVEVRKLNKMKRHDVLYVNQKLKLPSNPTL
jgi:N-acetylmuramoyl-L-alanine amidase